MSEHESFCTPRTPNPLLATPGSIGILGEDQAYDKDLVAPATPKKPTTGLGIATDSTTVNSLRALFHDTKSQLATLHENTDASQTGQEMQDFAFTAKSEPPAVTSVNAGLETDHKPAKTYRASVMDSIVECTTEHIHNDRMQESEIFAKDCDIWNHTRPHTSNVWGCCSNCISDSPCSDEFYSSSSLDSHDGWNVHINNWNNQPRKTSGKYRIDGVQQGLSRPDPRSSWFNDGIYLTCDQDDPFVIKHKSFLGIHNCKDFWGAGSLPRQRIFGCASAEIRIVSGGLMKHSTSFLVCEELMEKLATNWATLKAFSRYGMRTCITIVVSGDPGHTNAAASVLFQWLHDTDEGDPPFMNLDDLVYMTNLSCQLGCNEALRHVAGRWLSHILHDRFGSLHGDVREKVLYIAEYLKLDEVFQHLSRQMVLFSSENDLSHIRDAGGLHSSSLLYGMRFVRVAITPALEVIQMTRSIAIRKVLIAVEEAVHGHFPGDKALLDTTDNQKCAILARKWLQRGLATARMWPLLDPERIVLKKFVEDIKASGGADPCYKDFGVVQCPTAENGPLARLYHKLDDIVEGVEFLICQD